MHFSNDLCMIAAMAQCRGFVFSRYSVYAGFVLMHLYNNQCIFAAIEQCRGVDSTHCICLSVISLHSCTELYIFAAMEQRRGADLMYLIRPASLNCILAKICACSLRLNNTAVQIQHVFIVSAMMISNATAAVFKNTLLKYSVNAPCKTKTQRTHFVGVREREVMATWARYSDSAPTRFV